MGVRIISLFKNSSLQNSFSDMNSFLNLLSVYWARYSWLIEHPIQTPQGGAGVMCPGKRQGQGAWMATRKTWMKPQKQERAQQCRDL